MKGVLKTLFAAAVFGPVLHGVCSGYNAGSFDTGINTLKADYTSELKALQKGVNGLLDLAKRAVAP